MARIEPAIEVDGATRTSGETGPPNYGPGSDGSLADRGTEAIQQHKLWAVEDKDHKAPIHLQDYICYSAVTKDPTSSSPQQKVSSGNPYAIVNYITYDKFSIVHQQYLAAITKVV